MKSGAEGRLAREIEHHRQIAPAAEAIWNWDSPAGRRRADRRARIYVESAGLAPGRLALELGCGTGVFLEKVARSGCRLRGLDLSRDLLERAATRLEGAAEVELVCGNAEQMPFPDGAFDAVYGSSVLHHLDLEAALREVFRVLRPGGRMVFTEPNILNPQVAFMFHVPFTKRHFGVSPDEMAFGRFHARAVLERTGFRSVAVRPFDFLHPAVPSAWIEGVDRFGRALERLPVVREIAGSMILEAGRV